MKSLKDFNYLISLYRRYTKTESEIFRLIGWEIFFSQQLGIDFQLSLKGNLQELHDNIVSKILLLRPDANRSILMVNADKIILDLLCFKQCDIEATLLERQKLKLHYLWHRLASSLKR